jgi:hypothetical protein
MWKFLEGGGVEIVAKVKSEGDEFGIAARDIPKMSNENSCHGHWR